MAANTYYEAHITIDSEWQNAMFSVAGIGWKFSKIDGDPTLGFGLKSYATKHFKSSLDKNVVLKKLHDAAECLRVMGCHVIREKIELVIYDDRSSTVRFNCDGKCPECHLDDIIN